MENNNSQLNKRGSEVNNTLTGHYSTSNDNYPSYITLLKPSNNSIQNCITNKHCYIGTVLAVGFDTLKLKIPKRIILRTVPFGKVLGLYYFRSKQIEDYEVWGISAKILKSNYTKLINSNTISDVIDAINNSGILLVDKDKFLIEVKVFTAEVTTDIRFNNISIILKAIASCHLNNRYYIESFNRRNALQSFMFKRKSRHTHSVSVYSKLPELLKNNNQELREYINLSHYENVIRIECKFAHMDEFYSVFGIPSKNDAPFLSELINTNINPFISRFERIIDTTLYCPNNSNTSTSQMPAIDSFGSKKIQTKFAYYYYLHIYYSNNSQAVLAYLRNTATPYRSMSEYHTFLYNFEKFTNSNNEIVRYILALLSTTKINSSQNK